MSLYTINTSPFFYEYYGNHTHECYELILNLEGEGTLTVGDREFAFFPGSVHIIPPNTPHIKSSDNKFRDIYFLTDTLSASPATHEISAPIAFCDDSEKTLEKLMHMMLCRYRQGNKNDIILESMYDLALKIIEDSSLRQSNDEVVDALEERLTRSFGDPELSLSELLEATGYSKDHVRRRFIAKTGVTPGQYLTSLRVTHAKKLLRKQKELGLRIGDVGMLCGYYDARYFSRIFKAQTGLTPIEYVKKYDL